MKSERSLRREARNVSGGALASAGRPVRCHPSLPYAVNLPRLKRALGRGTGRGQRSGSVQKPIELKPLI